MQDPGVRQARRDRFWLVLIVLPPLLLFPRLGDIRLWQDEAETAMLGRCVRQHGYPLALDRGRVVTDQRGSDLDAHGVWVWSPWLPLYVVALSFASLGESTTTARLPFALLGWATLCVAYRVFLELTRNRRLSRLALLLLMTSIPLLLHARQCRYYTLLSFFGLIQLWGYVRLRRGERWGGLLFTAGAVGLYHSFFPQMFLALAAVAGHVATAPASERRVLLRRLLPCVPVIALLTLPFLLVTHGWSRDYDGSGHGLDDPLRYASTLRAYLLEIHKYAWPFLLVLPVLAATHARSRARAMPLALALATLALAGVACASPSRVSLALLLALAIAVAGLSAARAWSGSRARGTWPWLCGLWLVATVAGASALAPFPFFRYLMGVLPLFALATAASLRSLAARFRPLRPLLPALVAVVVLTDLVQYGPLALAAHALGGLEAPGPAGHRPSHAAASAVLSHVLNDDRCQSMLLDYLGELTHDYRGPVAAVIDHLASHARRGDVVVTTYEHFPLMFYTQLEVLQNDDARERDALPEWLFLHGTRAQTLGRRISQALDGGRYRRVDLGAVELPWENIPEPYWHLFRTPASGPSVRFYQLVHDPP